MGDFLEAEFVERGCKSRKEAAIAVQVYLELCEVKKYWDVQYFYDNTLETIYFTAKRKRTATPSVFVPVPVSESLSFANLQNYLKICDKSSDQTVCIVIVHSDSTCVYYQITNGLAGPPAAAAQKTSKQDAKLDVTLKRNRQLLEEAAMYGIPITIPKKQCADEGTSLS